VRDSLCRKDRQRTSLVFTRVKETNNKLLEGFATMQRANQTQPLGNTDVRGGPQPCTRLDRAVWQRAAGGGGAGVARSSKDRTLSNKQPAHHHQTRKVHHSSDRSNSLRVGARTTNAAKRDQSEGDGSFT
jgi:hypothetical protein